MSKAITQAEYEKLVAEAEARKTARKTAMITGISIENFKGIGERIDLQLKPLTLLFGANSAGKSTVLHALHYAREVLERHNLDADRTVAGGPFVDLGGFRNFAHMRDLDLPMRFTFRLDLQDTYLPDYGTPMTEFQEPNPPLAEVRRCEIRLEIAWSHRDEAPFIREYAVWFDDEWFGVIHKEAGRPGCTLRINLAHPSLLSVSDVQARMAPNNWGVVGPGKLSYLASLFLIAYRPESDSGQPFQYAKNPETVTVALGSQKDALPRWEQKVSFEWHDGAEQPTANQYTWLMAGEQPAHEYTSIDEVKEAYAKGEIELSMAMEAVKKCQIELSKKAMEKDAEAFLERDIEFSKAMEAVEKCQIELSKLLEIMEVMVANDRVEEWDWENQHGPHEGGLPEWTIEEVSQLLVGPGQLVRDALTGFRYLGPLRETPSRDHAPPRFPDPSRWASGLGAWDTLASGDEEFVNVVSHWLGDPERLNAGYNVHCKRFKELDLSDPWVVQLLTGRAIDDADSIRLSLEKLPTRSRIQILPSTAHGRVSQNAVEMQSQDVGVGISQVLPVIVTALDGKGRLLAIEQPELHLHPRFQAELADLFIQAAKGETAHTLILETHSEHLILRLQRRIREQAKEPATNLPPITDALGRAVVALKGRAKEPATNLPQITGDDVVIYHVTQQAGQTTANRIELDRNGDFIQPWPDDFFEIDFYERFGHAD